MDQLQLFYENKALYESVRQYFSEVLRETAADYALAGKPTEGFSQAKVTIDKAFSTLKENYEPKKTITKTSPR